MRHIAIPLAFVLAAVVSRPAAATVDLPSTPGKTLETFWEFDSGG